MRGLGPVIPAPAIRVTDAPGRQNPTPVPTDEKGNPKHWVKKRIEQQQQQQQQKQQQQQQPQPQPQRKQEQVASTMLAEVPNQVPSPPASQTSPLRQTLLQAASPLERKAAILADLLDQEWLQQYTGQTDLSQVRELRVQVDTRKAAIEHLGWLLPRLCTLGLSRSRLDSIRDLGTSLAHLTNLDLSKCGLEALDGIAALSGLRELDVAHNCIEDVTPLGMHDNLQILDLSDNRIGDLASLEMLGSCSELRRVCLAGNAVCALKTYRQLVGSAVPQLLELDGRKVAPDERTELDDAALEDATLVLLEMTATNRAGSEVGGAAVSAAFDSPCASPARPSPRPPGTPDRAKSMDSEGKIEPESRLTLDQGFLAGSPSKIRQRHRSKKEVWSGTILEVLDHPDRDIDIIAPAPPAAGEDLRISEAVRGNPILASLYDSMLQQSARGSSSGDESPPVSARGRRRKPKGSSRGSPAREEDHICGDEATPRSVGNASMSSDTPRLTKQASLPWPSSTMPLPVRLGSGGDQPAAEARDSFNMTGWNMGDDRSESGRRGVQIPSDAQKAGVRLGFNLEESLAAINQWIDDVEDDDNVVTHRCHILQQVPSQKCPDGSSAGSSSRRSSSTTGRPYVRTGSYSTYEGERLKRSSQSSLLSASSFSTQDHRRSLEDGTPRGRGGCAMLGVNLEDEILIEMLSLPPKRVPPLKTREAFRDFFKGMPAGRMESLLLRAYMDRPSEDAREKIRKRMALVEDVLLGL